MKNAIIPYVLIMAFGVGLIFFLSLEGNSNQEEIASEHGTESTEGQAPAEAEGPSQGEPEGEGTEGGGAEGGEAGTDFDPVAVYEANCASCHGANYEGGVGPALAGAGIPEDEAAEVIANGRGIMPGGLVEEENIDAMAAWVAGLE